MRSQDHGASVKPAAMAEINADYPAIAEAGNFQLDTTQFLDDNNRLTIASPACRNSALPRAAFAHPNSPHRSRRPRGISPQSAWTAAHPGDMKCFALPRRARSPCR